MKNKKIIPMGYIGKNFKQAMSNFSIEISQTAENEFNFGVLKKDSEGTLFENPHYAYLKEMTLEELVELKNGVNILVTEIEESAKTND